MSLRTLSWNNQDWVWPTPSLATRFLWTWTGRISPSFSRSVCSNCSTKISTLLPCASKNGILGISPNSPGSFRTTSFSYSWSIWLEIGPPLLPLSRKSRKRSPMDSSLNVSLTLPRTRWDKKSVTSILHALRIFARRPSRCTSSGLKFKATSRAGWKSLLPTSPAWLAKMWLPNLSLTLDHSLLFQNIQLPPFRFLELKKHSSVLWSKRPKPPNMDSSTTHHSLGEPWARTKVKFPVSSPTSALWLLGWTTSSWM